jgi:hypothetical protein
MAEKKDLTGLTSREESLSVSSPTAACYRVTPKGSRFSWLDAATATSR